MKKNLCLFFMMFFSITVFAQQSGFSGKIIDQTSGKPLSNVYVSLRDQNTYAKSDAEGNFIILKDGIEQVLIDFILAGYNEAVYQTEGQPGVIVKLGAIKMSPLINDWEITTIYVDESQINDEDGSSQTIGSLSNASDDVFLRAASFNFSAMRYSLRGYNQEYSSTYVNGVSFNDGVRGRFNFSSFGGMNALFKNKDVVRYTDASSFSYGDIGGTTNVISKASGFAKGTNVSVGATNRSYVLRGMVNVGTGILPSGWAFNGGLIYRWSEEGAWDGTFYNAFGYYLGAEKIFNEKHSISLITYGAPTERAQNAAVTQEAVDLHGDIYYNPYWGYQNGKKRNSRVVNSYDPTAVLAYEWKISENQKLNVGLGSHYSKYSTTALTFYNAPDPRPDYYRYMPSYIGDREFLTGTDAALYDEMYDLWKNDASVSQIDWDNLYAANYRNNEVNPDGTAKYAVEERHSNLFETSLNAVYSGKFSKLKVTGGLEAKYTKSMNYKTMSDLLGANQWIDIDQFSERDFPNNTDIIQNDMNNPNRVIYEGDKFGYNFNVYVKKASVFIQNEWNFRQLDFYYAAKATYTSFQREGLMDNGRSSYFQSMFAGIYKPSVFKSYGKGKETYFITPSFKGGLAYKIDGRNKISVNANAEQRAPLSNYSYVSPRVMDRQIVNLKAEKILSYDVNYEFSYRRIRGRVTAFQTHFTDGSERNGYYDDTYQTFINQTLTGVDKRYRGIEAAARIKLTSIFELTAAGSYGEYQYTSNAISILSSENGSLEQEVGAANINTLNERVYIKGLRTNNGPQLAASLGLKINAPKSWFGEIKGSYYDNSYIDFNPNRYTASAFEKYNTAINSIVANQQYTTAEKRRLISGVQALQEQEKFDPGFMIDVSVGKVIYFNNRAQSMNINLNANNILNNTSMKTGGYQQARLPLSDGSLDVTGLGKFPNKYYYAQGFNFFLNVGYRF